MRISTLAKYVGALGGERDLVIRSKDGAEVIYRSAGVAKNAAKKSAAKKANRTQLAHRSPAHGFPAEPLPGGRDVPTPSRRPSTTIP